MFFRLIRLSVLLSLSELKEKSLINSVVVRWFIGEFHAFPIKKTKWDVDNGHSKECRSFAVDLHVHCNTFKIRFWVVYKLTQAYGDACRRDRTRNTQPPNADTIDFFFWSEKKGGSSAPSEPPLATCLICHAEITHTDT